MKAVVFIFFGLFLSFKMSAQNAFNEAEVIIETECETEVTEVVEDKIETRLRKIQKSVPLDYNEHVQNYINVYLLKKKSTAEKCLGRSKKYFPVFEEAFAKYGVPQELKYLAVIESALNPLAVSKKGATGIFQFMFSTAKMYDLTINKFVDERRDPYLSAEAAAKYLLNSYNKYGNWLHVIASYNCGPGNVDRAIKKAGGSSDFWDIYPYLPAETRGYVPAFIAAYYVMTSYKELGLTIQYPEGIPVKTTRVPVKEKVMLEHLQDRLGILASELKYHNPSLLTKTVTAGYYLTLPEEMVAIFSAQEDTLYAMANGGLKPPPKNDSLLAAKQKKEVPPKPEKQTPVLDKIFKKQKKEPVVEPKKKEPVISEAEPEEEGLYFPEDPDLVALVYSVKPGDNMGFIATWYHCSVSDIKKWNGLRNNSLSIGQELLIYVHRDDQGQFERFEYLSGRLKNKLSKRIPARTQDEKEQHTTQDVTKQGFTDEKKQDGQSDENNPSPAGKTQPVEVAKKTAIKEEDCFVTHKVRSGDALWDLSKRYKTSVADIQKLNSMGNSSKLKPGQTLKVARKKC